MKLFTLVQTISGIKKNLTVQQHFLQQHIAPILQSAKRELDGSLDDADFKKITQYYGLAVPAILASAFCVLHGREMSAAERWTATCQGAMTGLFDDFFDKSFLSDEAILEKTVRGSTSAKKQNEKLFDVFYTAALTNVHDCDQMIQALKKVYDAQVESKKQVADLSVPEILHITLVKGGTSLLFYRTSINEKISDVEKEMLFIAGGLMQLCNDIFDVYKDREVKIRTLATCCTSVDDLRAAFHQQLQSVQSSLSKLPFQQKNKEQFFRLIDLAVFSRTEVCLQQLAKTEKIHGEYFVREGSRKELICDMDNLRNKLRSAYYFLKH